MENRRKSKRNLSSFILVNKTNFEDEIFVSGGEL